MSIDTKIDRGISLSAIEDIARQAFIYGYPLIEHYKTMFKMAIDPDKKEPGRELIFNEFIHTKRLFGPENRNVVTPNNETLYSKCWLDLRRGSVSLSLLNGKHF